MMKQLSLVLLVMSFCSQVLALSGRQYVSLGAGLRYDKAETQNITASNTQYALSYAYDYQKNSRAQIELSNYSSVSGDSALGLEKSHTEFILWGSYLVRSVYPELRWVLGAGIGLFQDKISTTLVGEQSQDVGRLNMLGGASLGFEAELSKNFYGSIEGRMLFSRDLYPSSQTATLVKLGWMY